MTGTACYWLEPTSTVQVGLRRYTPSDEQPDPPCPRENGTWRYHGAVTILGNVPVAWTTEKPAGTSHWFHDAGDRYGIPAFTYPGHDDVRWPEWCECGYQFQAGDAWQEWFDLLYQRADTGELTTLREAPDGAMWDATWYGWKGPDGRCLVVKAPGGHDWIIDGRATNCTMPEDNEHRCWVRHGEPPAVTVDKNGFTCAAGGGSIQVGGYHGFLRAGVFDP